MKKLLLALTLCFVLSACVRIQTPVDNPQGEDLQSTVDTEVLTSQEDENIDDVNEYAWQNDIAAQVEKDISDYYFLLPAEYFYCDDDPARHNDEGSNEKRAELVEYINIENDYLLAQNTLGDEVQVARFISKDRTPNDMIAVIVNSGIGSMCNKRDFLIWTDARGWEHVSPIEDHEIQEAFEGVSYSFDAWILPEYGTTIRVVDIPEEQAFTYPLPDTESLQQFEDLMTLEWKGGRFHVKK